MAKTPTLREGIEPFPACRNTGMIIRACACPTLRSLTGLKAEQLNKCFIVNGWCRHSRALLPRGDTSKVQSLFSPVERSWSIDVFFEFYCCAGASPHPIRDAQSGSVLNNQLGHPCVLASSQYARLKKSHCRSPVRPANNPIGRHWRGCGTRLPNKSGEASVLIEVYCPAPRDGAGQRLA